ncbi:hypothetical protein E1281_17930 [Actinomadura sp. KC345]|uniref:hypothetical protein n=1 Tax=Actinomadura sp. KC345 TaxID=2530371 RepID=UPI00104A043E|nr:hypothetical protein [Actinomadura sp. KC345]TDC53334.1 hypothetical protein E1281_17930 [Actinomadura sp. KC345]
MEHRRSDRGAPEGGPTPGQRAWAAGTAGPGGGGDTHVAGPSPETPVLAAPESVPDTAPDPVPAPPPGDARAARAESTPAPTPAGTPAKLFDPAESERFRERWREVQSAFVDDPGGSVRRADDLASEAVDALGRAIAAHRRTLSEGLEGRGHADTERLRLALRGYRDLLDRIFAS